MKKEQNLSPLYGLVLAGGKSKRMKKDKAVLEFHGKKQFVYCYELLEGFCEKVFISSRTDQTNREGQKEFPQILDQKPFVEIGPLGGILSAMIKYPKTSWLVLAVDLPFVNESTIRFLLNHRNPDKLATAFVSTHDHLPEPLCAVYEAHSITAIKSFYEKGTLCPRKFLIGSDVELLKQREKRALDNVNSLHEYKEVLAEMKGKLG